MKHYEDNFANNNLPSLDLRPDYLDLQRLFKTAYKRPDGDRTRLARRQQRLDGHGYQGLKAKYIDAAQVA